MDRNTLLLIIAGIAVIIILLWPKQLPEPIIEGADGTWQHSLNRISKDLRAMPRPLGEYPNAASTRSITKAPFELEEQASKVLPRPLIEYSDSALSTALEAMPSSLTALPRPLVEYANSGAVFALEPPIVADFTRVEPRPLVEFADGGWITSLSPPLGLLQGEGKK